MKTRTRRLALLLSALSFTAGAWAQNTVKSSDILNALTTVPKAAQGPDGRWIQRDPSIDLQVQFDFNKAELTTAGQQQLDELGRAFQQPALAGFSFEVAGHTDKAGSEAYNLKLSTERANAARDYLMKKHGIVAERIVSKGYGYSRLAQPDQPASAINRRVEIRRLATVAAAQTGQAGVAVQPALQPPQNMAPASGGVIIQRQ